MNIVRIIRLLTVDEIIFDKVPTIKKMRSLYDNYEMDSYVKETVSSNEQKEEDDFIREMLDTPVMKTAMKFLHQKGQFSMHALTRIWAIKRFLFSSSERRCIIETPR